MSRRKLTGMTPRVELLERRDLLCSGDPPVTHYYGGVPGWPNGHYSVTSVTYSPIYSWIGGKPAAAKVVVPLATLGNPTWSSLPNVPLGRSEAQGASVGGKFSLFGGYTNFQGVQTLVTPSSQVHVYNPATNAWTRLHDLKRRRRSGSRP